SNFMAGKKVYDHRKVQMVVFNFFDAFVGVRDHIAVGIVNVVDIPGIQVVGIVFEPGGVVCFIINLIEPVTIFGIGIDQIIYFQGHRSIVQIAVTLQKCNIAVQVILHVFIICVCKRRGFVVFGIDSSTQAIEGIVAVPVVS